MFQSSMRFSEFEYVNIRMVECSYPTNIAVTALYRCVTVMLRRYRQPAGRHQTGTSPVLRILYRVTDTGPVPAMFRCVALFPVTTSRNTTDKSGLFQENSVLVLYGTACTKTTRWRMDTDPSRIGTGILYAATTVPFLARYRYSN